jgi:hypothetical protein
MELPRVKIDIDRFIKRSIASSNNNIDDIIVIKDVINNLKEFIENKEIEIDQMILDSGFKGQKFIESIKKYLIMFPVTDTISKLMLVEDETMYEEYLNKDKGVLIDKIV